LPGAGRDQGFVVGIDFPPFVAALIKGVFDAIVDASGQVRASSRTGFAIAANALRAE
jgi:hypothetical protein